MDFTLTFDIPSLQNTQKNEDGIRMEMEGILGTVRFSGGIR